MIQHTPIGSIHPPPPNKTGVRLKGGHVLSADLVADASGRGSKTPEWLEAGGWAPPPVITVDANLVGFESGVGDDGQQFSRCTL